MGARALTVTFHNTGLPSAKTRLYLNEWQVRHSNRRVKGGNQSSKAILNPSIPILVGVEGINASVSIKALDVFTNRQESTGKELTYGTSKETNLQNLQTYFCKGFKQKADPISRSLETLGAIAGFLSGDEPREKSSVSDSGERVNCMSSGLVCYLRIDDRSSVCKFTESAIPGTNLNLIDFMSIFNPNSSYSIHKSVLFKNAQRHMSGVHGGQSYRWLWATVWGLGIKSGSFGRTDWFLNQN
ncbi:hypothetical protein STEG23_013377 [Scotinomys teguina]